MKAVFINGSPRKNGNTCKMLEAARKGAEHGGAETELIHLYEYEYTGCRSCFACKLKNNNTNGLCVIRDTLRPILEKAIDADVLVLGSPVYFNSPSGQLRSFVERLAFPNLSYSVDENGKPLQVAHKQIQTGVIYTMNTAEEDLTALNYPVLLGEIEHALAHVFGHSETLYACQTVQFSDYSRYEANMFDEMERLRYREEYFELDLEKAFQMGLRLTGNSEITR